MPGLCLFSVISTVVVLILHSVSTTQSLSIADFGAIPNLKTWEVAVHNSECFSKALLQANQSRVDRTVEFPAGTTYYLANSTHADLQSVHVQVDGTVIFSDDIKKFPLDEGGGGRNPFWQFTNSEFLHLSGSGVIDGQGLEWWRLCYTGNDKRPLLIEFYQCREIVIEGVYLLNSPRYSINFKDCENIVVHDITIFIDSVITRLHNRSSAMYPLNTDGIDINARNVTIYNTNITNYDDAIVPKPCHQGGKYCQCSEDMMIYNNTIAYSVGLSIGSVPPNTDVNCVRNITFKDTYMYRPFKALYIKSNPGMLLCFLCYYFLIYVRYHVLTIHIYILQAPAAPALSKTSPMRILSSNKRYGGLFGWALSSSTNQATAKMAAQDVVSSFPLTRLALPSHWLQFRESRLKILLLVTRCLSSKDQVCYIICICSTISIPFLFYFYSISIRNHRCFSVRPK